MTEHVTKDGEIIETGEHLPALPEGYGRDGSLAVALAKAEVDQQVTTARVYPRNLRRAMDSILSHATLDEETAAECIYALPRGGKAIRGPSVRLAEIIASQWGNCRVGARVVHVDRVEKFIEAEGVFHDLETNHATTARVRRSIADKYGRLFNNDMIVVTGNAACSIAKRNAILAGVPKAVWRKAYDAAEQVLKGDVKTLVERREKAIKTFAAFGVKPEQICEALGVNSVEALTVDHLADLMGMYSAIKSGEETVESMFGRASAGDAPKGTKAKLDAIADQGKPRADEPKQEPAQEKPAKADEPAAEAEAGDDGDLAERAAIILENLGHSPKGIDADDPGQVIAYAAGIEAAKAGRSRRAVPPEYRTEERQAEAAAWQLGHDYASASKGD